MNEIEMDETAYATRGKPESFGFTPKAPPCDGCEHATRCASESLACCAFAQYVGILKSHTTRVRGPSAAWYACVEGDGPVPRCQCKRRHPINRKAAAAIVQKLKDAPGTSSLALSEAAGISTRAAKSALERLRSKGLVNVVGYGVENGHRNALWELTGNGAAA